uniref:Mitotic spindle assembly checkpoint protein MAD2A n=1 Tax=Steinernema glaseri TaxID=37863 RepID=A0A1I8ALR8_9BILA
MATDTLTRSSITLKGSAVMVKEFFYYGINSILYQRGIYPADLFKREKKYGLTCLVSTDSRVQKFLEPMLKQVEVWLEKKLIKRLVFAIFEVKTKEVVERWQFDISTDQEMTETCSRKVDEAKIRMGMADVIRQITASITFLPLLEKECSFDVLIYTFKNTEAPVDWSDSDACLVKDGEQVKLRSFSTGVHDVQAQVTYKTDY